MGHGHAAVLRNLCRQLCPHPVATSCWASGRPRNGLGVSEMRGALFGSFLQVKLTIWGLLIFVDSRINPAKGLSGRGLQGLRDSGFGWSISWSWLALGWVQTSDAQEYTVHYDRAAGAPSMAFSYSGRPVCVVFTPCFLHGWLRGVLTRIWVVRFVLSLGFGRLCNLEACG